MCFFFSFLSVVPRHRLSDVFVLPLHHELVVETCFNPSPTKSQLPTVDKQSSYLEPTKDFQNNFYVAICSILFQSFVYT